MVDFGTPGDAGIIQKTPIGEHRSDTLEEVPVASQRKGLSMNPRKFLIVEAKEATVEHLDVDERMPSLILSYQGTSFSAGKATVTPNKPGAVVPKHTKLNFGDGDQPSLVIFPLSQNLESKNVLRCFFRPDADSDSEAPAFTHGECQIDITHDQSNSNHYERQQKISQESSSRFRLLRWMKTKGEMRRDAGEGLCCANESFDAWFPIHKANAAAKFSPNTLMRSRIAVHPSMQTAGKNATVRGEIGELRLRILIADLVGLPSLVRELEASKDDLAAQTENLTKTSALLRDHRSALDIAAGENISLLDAAEEAKTRAAELEERVQHLETQRALAGDAKGGGAEARELGPREDALKKINAEVEQLRRSLRASEAQLKKERTMNERRVAGIAKAAARVRAASEKRQEELEQALDARGRLTASLRRQLAMSKEECSHWKEAIEDVSGMLRSEVAESFAANARALHAHMHKAGKAHREDVAAEESMEYKIEVPLPPGAEPTKVGLLAKGKGRRGTN
jgi:hypothetical protein